MPANGTLLGGCRISIRWACLVQPALEWLNSFNWKSSPKTQPHHSVNQQCHHADINNYEQTIVGPRSGKDQENQRKRRPNPQHVWTLCSHHGERLPSTQSVSLRLLQNAVDRKQQVASPELARSLKICFPYTTSTDTTRRTTLYFSAFLLV